MLVSNGEWQWHSYAKVLPALVALLALVLRCTQLALVHVPPNRPWNPRKVLTMPALGRVACGAVRRSHGAVSGASFTQSLQYTLRTTARLKQSACRQRLPPPCALQCGVSPEAAAVVQPAS